ncbi:MAG TPA: hypothetical protein H9684_01295 [Firmicutes bacterium]|nr:hypothetical protein [Bacillota bacterium]
MEKGNRTGIRRRLLAAGLTLAMLAAMLGAGTVSAKEETAPAEAYWSSFARDSGNAAVVDSKLPASLDEMEMILYGQEENLVSQDPIIVGERMYLVVASAGSSRRPVFDTLAVYDLEGNRLKETKLYGRTGYFSRICYGDGKIFVLLSDRIQAFDAETLESLWLTPAENQMLCTITYNDGYIYTGYTSGGSGGTGATEGAYVCLSTEDEDPSKTDEVKDYVWKSETGGYYWAGGVVVGSRIYFAGDSGVLYSHHLTEDIVYDAYDLGDLVRSNLIYDATTNRLIVATKNTAQLFTIELNRDGTFNRQTVRRTAEGVIGGVTGGVSAYNGRIYVPSGGMHALSSSFAVLDAETLEAAYYVEGLSSQSVPLITTAYASAENSRTVYVYAIDYVSGVGYVFEDQPGQTEYKEVMKIGTDVEIGGKRYRATGYNSSSFKADQYGNLYMIGGSNTYFGTYNGADYETGAASYALTVFRNVNAEFTAQDVENAISLLPGAQEAEYTDKKAVLAAEKRYEGLAPAEQTKVSNAAALTALTDRMDALTASLVAQAEAEIAKIPADITLADEAAVETASFLYGSLLEEDKRLVAGRETLAAAVEALYDLKGSIDGLIENIALLPDAAEVTAQDKAAVNELWAAFQALSEADRERVTNADRLLAAKDKLQELDDLVLLPSVEEKIAALPSAAQATLLEDEEAVKAVYEEFAALHANVQAQAAGREKLEAVYQAILGYRAAVDEIDRLIWNELDPQNITLADRETVAAIAAKYAALRDSEKACVQYYDDVIDAQAIIASLEKGVIPALVFDNIRDTDRDYTVSGEGYSITFNGLEIVRPADFRYGMTLGDTANSAAIEKLAEDPFAFSFDQSGAFPGRAAVELSVGGPDGQRVLYRYVADSGRAEKVQTVTVAGGKALLTLEEGGEYFIAVTLTTEAAPDSPSGEGVPSTGEATAAGGMILLALGALAALLAAKRGRR